MYLRSAALWVVVAFTTLAAARAVALSFTLDESMSFFFARSNSWKDIVTYATPFANNHLINTLWLKLVGGSLGIYNELPLRLLNVAAAGVFAWYAWKLCRQLTQHTGLALAGTLLFLCNPYVNDFFSLARGYGLSLAFETASLYYLSVYCTEGQLKNLTRTLTTGALAVLSNFTFLNFYIALLAGILMVMAIRRNRTPRDWYRIGLVTLLLVAVIYEPVRKLKAANALFYGGDKGFYLDSFQSLVRFSYSGAQDIGDNNTLWALVFIVFAWTILSGLPGLAAFLRHRFDVSYLPYGLGLMFFLLIYAGTTLQFMWFKTPYLITRTTILLYPMMAMSWVAGLALAARWWKARAAMYLLALIGLFGWARGLNFSFSVEWSAESQARQTIRWFMDHEGSRTEDKKLSVGCFYTYGPTLTYYMFKNDIRWMHRIREWPFEMPQPDTDYMVVHSNQVGDLSSTYLPLETLPGPTYRSWSPLVIMKKK